jgi:CRISPR type III-A/MTUBE-associated protein Csm6
MECNIIKREDLTKVQEYDFFFGEFYKCLKEIKEKEKQKGDDYEILVNVSSGTPAMKSGLLVLAVMADISCKVIQVTTPTGKMNEHVHKGYDVETLWELDEDNDPDFINRCHEVHCPTLSMMKQQESLCELIKKYDYSGAIDIAIEL